MTRIWIEFQHLATRLRSGSASLDSVLFDAESLCKVDPSGAASAGPKRRGGARAEAEDDELPKNEGAPPELLSLPPSPDHALAYSVFEDCGVSQNYLIPPLSHYFYCISSGCSDSSCHFRFRIIRCFPRHGIILIYQHY